MFANAKCWEVILRIDELAQATSKHVGKRIASSNSRINNIKRSWEYSNQFKNEWSDKKKKQKSKEKQILKDFQIKIEII